MRWSLLLAIVLPSRDALAAESFEGWAFYTGDPHVHSGISKDGGSSDIGKCMGTCGSFYSIFEDGRAEGLDWMGVSDHTNGDGGSPMADADQYATLTRMALDAHDPDGGFVTVPAAEVWARVGATGGLGHVTALLFGDNEDLEALEMYDLQPSGSESIGLDSCADFHDWMQDVEDTFGRALMIPHHPAAKKPMSVDWTCFYSAFQPAVEVYSEHGQSLTDDSTGFDPMWSGAVTSGTVHYALDPEGLGLQMGFMGGSDSHDTRPGKICQIDTVHISHPYGGGHTVAVLDETERFDRDSLYQAIVDRRTYATSGPSIPLVIEYSTGGVLVAQLGGEIGIPTDQDLDVEVRMPSEWDAYILNVYLVTPDETFTMDHPETGTWDYSFAFDELPAWTYVKVEIDGETYYPEGSCEDGGPDLTEYIWASPSWITEVSPDLDDDGVSYLDGDCDDDNAEISPLLEEIWYDGVDQDCDGADDDQDGDGYELDEDCDDTDPTANPGETENWYDGVDQDCDGQDDDQDGDGRVLSEDCDDTDASTYPDATEVWYDGVDQDCDGLDDDQDGDGFILSEDCDDTDPASYPDAAEVWYDGVDQDCDGLDDDQDGDGFTLAEDCDDLDPGTNPDAGEIWYDGVDQDCDGRDDDQDEDGHGIDEDCDDLSAAVGPDAEEIWYDGVDQDCDGNDDDQDGDGVGLSTDCDDLDATVSPGAMEVWYDGVDQDCDGADDDQDGDGYLLAEDCDDTSASVNLDAEEVWYDGVDQDCDGNDDDQDGDGYGYDRDCDDRSLSVHPGASDVCADGVDQDCDGADAICMYGSAWRDVIMTESSAGAPAPAGSDSSTEGATESADSPPESTEEHAEEEASSSEPVEGEPEAAEPEPGEEPAEEEASSSEPVESEPEASEPEAAEPVEAEPEAAEPEVADPAESEPERAPTSAEADPSEGTPLGDAEAGGDRPAELTHPGAIASPNVPFAGGQGAQGEQSADEPAERPGEDLGPASDDGAPTAGSCGSCASGAASPGVAAPLLLLLALRRRVRRR